MKKKLVAMLMVMTLAVSVTACGDAKSDSKTSETTGINNAEGMDVNPDDYVTLCEYEDLEVTANTFTFTEQNVKDDVAEQFEYYVEQKDAYNYTDIKDRDDVQDGDFCNIDYEGVKDGVAFDGGTAQGYDLEIGSGSFIDGFEEGLIGHKVGETVDLDLTFPEEYHSEELAGAAVVFHVKINSIRTREMPEMTDKVIADLDCGYKTVKEFEDSVRDSLKEECEQEAENNKKDAMWDMIFDSCEVKDPTDDMIAYYKNELNHQMQQYADMYSMELEAFVEQYMGMDAEAYDAQLAEGAVDSAKQDLIVQAIAKKAGIEMSNEDFQKFVEQDYANYGYESSQQMLDDIGEHSYKMYRLNQLVEDYLLGVVTFKDGGEHNIREYYDENFEEEELDEGDEAASEELEIEEEEVDPEGDE